MQRSATTVNDVYSSSMPALLLGHIIVLTVRKPAGQPRPMTSDNRYESVSGQSTIDVIRDIGTAIIKEIING